MNRDDVIIELVKIRRRVDWLIGELGGSVPSRRVRTRQDPVADGERAPRMGRSEKAAAIVEYGVAWRRVHGGKPMPKVWFRNGWFRIGSGDAEQVVRAGQFMRMKAELEALEASDEP